jgi:endonuclease/exonuclease/phosphatase (EEP) superfamily protein YafD
VKQPTIVAGDFNSVSTFCAPAKLKEIGLLDAFAAVHDDPEVHVTWQWPTRPLPLRLRIDYIFHTKHFTALDAQVIRGEGSDHSLVLAALRLGQEGVASDSDRRPGPDR